MNYKILKINDDKIANLVQLESEAEDEGYNFIGRAMYEFLCGKNDFTGKGEILYGAYVGQWCLGICGLNIDPYTNEKGIGRVRHLYVSEQFRNKGIATALVEKVIDQAKKHFKILRLKSTPDAIDFYDKMGFSKSVSEHETHRMVLEG